MAQELKVIQDFYDFMLWLIRHTEKFPRHHRYALGMAMENRLQRILELLLRAKYSRKKSEYLSDANIELEVLRFQMRLAKAGGGKRGQEPLFGLALAGGAAGAREIVHVKHPPLRGQAGRRGAGWGGGLHGPPRRR